MASPQNAKPAPIEPKDHGAPSCHGGLKNLSEEHSYWIDNVAGQVPLDLTGTFFRNGPGRQRIGEEQYGHWFDGDGMLCAFTFAEGKVHFKNSYVKTPKYLDETSAQRIRHRGFGTQIPGGLKSNFLKMPANPANTNVIYHGGKLLALYEGGQPWEVAPDSLETLGEHTYNGALSRSNVFSAHGKVHQRTGDYINFGAGISGVGLRGPKTCLNLYRINAAGNMVVKSAIPLDSFPFCHDFALTDKYAVFFINSIEFAGMSNVLLGRKTFADVAHFNAQKSMAVYVVELDTLNVVAQFETDPGAIIHFGNAFDDGEQIVIDGMYASDFDANEALRDVFSAERFGGGSYRRYRLDLQTKAITWELVTEVESEFPTFNLRKAGLKHNFCYTACSIDNGANSFFNGFQKLNFEGDTTLVTLPPGQYGSEPMFAQAADAQGEDDGYLLEVVYDAHQHLSELQIYRAQNPTDRVCTLGLRHHIPHQFHGFFSNRVFS